MGESAIRRNLKEHIFVAFLNCAERDEPVDVNHRHNRIMSQSGRIQLTLESQLQVIRSSTINPAEGTISFHWNNQLCPSHNCFSLEHN